MPQYMLLIYAPLDGRPSPEEMAAEMPRWYEYTEGLKEAEALVAGDPLHGVDAATTVRVRNGKVSVTDGPFAETNEQIGGFILIEAKDLNEAIQIASKVPVIRLGAIEVRPIKELFASTSE